MRRQSTRTHTTLAFPVDHRPLEREIAYVAVFRYEPDLPIIHVTLTRAFHTVRLLDMEKIGNFNQCLGSSRGLDNCIGS